MPVSASIAITTANWPSRIRSRRSKPARHTCRDVFNGYGERCGNANLCSVIPNLELKMNRRCLPDGKLSLLTGASRYINEVANLIPNERAAFVGRSAFAHKGGIHVSAVARVKETYEHIHPEDVGMRPAS